VLREIDLPLVPKRARRARVVEPAGAGPTDEEGRLVTEIDDPSLPRAVILRESRSSRASCRSSRNTSAGRSTSGRTTFDATAVTRERPDVVIQEIVGRHLYNFIPSPELVPEVGVGPR
jgi:hypothetical protein